MDVIEGRGVTALVHNPNKYERVSFQRLFGHDKVTRTDIKRSANATTRSPTTQSKTCKKRVSSCTCSSAEHPRARLRHWNPHYRHSSQAVVAAIRSTPSPPLPDSRHLRVNGCRALLADRHLQRAMAGTLLLQEVQMSWRDMSLLDTIEEEVICLCDLGHLWPFCHL